MRPWLALGAWWGSPDDLPAGPCLLSLGLSAKPSYRCSRPSIHSSGFLTGFLGWTPEVPCKTLYNFVFCLYPGRTLELCHKPIFSLLSWLCFLEGSCPWLLISPSLGLSMDFITTTSLALLRQCGASFKLPSFPSCFSPWRCPALSAPWWVAPFGIHVCTAAGELPGSLHLVMVWPSHGPCSLLKKSRVCLNISLLHMVAWTVGVQGAGEFGSWFCLVLKAVPASAWNPFVFSSHRTELSNLLCDFGQIQSGFLSPFVSGRDRVSLVQCQIHIEIQMFFLMRCCVL